MAQFMSRAQYSGCNMATMFLKQFSSEKCNVFFSAFHSAKDDVDIDALAAEIEGAGAGKEQNKSKSKKKKEKKDNFE